MTRVLFICGKNRRRSPSAEEIFVGMDGVEVSSAGVGAEAVCPVSGSAGMGGQGVCDGTVTEEISERPFRAQS